MKSLPGIFVCWKWHDSCTDRISVLCSPARLQYYVIVLVSTVFLSSHFGPHFGITRLVYWEERKWNYSRGFYVCGLLLHLTVATYAGFTDGHLSSALGVLQVLNTSFMGASFAILTYHASQKLHEVSFWSLIELKYSHDPVKDPSCVSSTLPRVSLRRR